MNSKTPNLLGRAFFARNTIVVAREMLGAKIVRRLDNQVLSGLIVETEAYQGHQDSASHAFKGQTPRNQVMFGPPGFAYVYLIYGLHNMFNVITEADSVPGAVLVRAIAPLQGQKTMRLLRNSNGRNLTNGPGKLCQALGIDRQLNRWDLTQGSEIWLERGETIPSHQIEAGPRIGIGYARQQDQEASWRFWVKE